MNKERVQIDTTLNKGAGLIRLSLMFLFSWQRLFNVSDVGLDILLKFIATFLRFLAKIFTLPLMPFLDQFPRGIAAAKKFLGYQSDDFVKYAVCPSCHTIYNIDDCKRMLANNTVVSATCDYVVSQPSSKVSEKKMRDSFNEICENIVWFCFSVSILTLLLQEHLSFIAKIIDKTWLFLIF